METPSFAREIDEIADADTHVLDLTREEDREKLGRVVRIMSEQAVYAELAMLARTAKERDRSKVFRPLDAAAQSS
jgi:hypothetical protein